MPPLRFVSPFPRHRSEPLSKPTGARRRGSAIILVVERDPHVRELEAFFLEEAGFGVEMAADGEEALSLVRSKSPDLVITEILVPRLDGLAVCKRIKDDPDLPTIRVVVFSILAAEARAAEAGADAFLRKPLKEQSLVRTVQELLAMDQATS